MTTLKDLRSTFVYGPMKSGKSEFLIETIELLLQSEKPFITFKPRMDSRDYNFISSRNPNVPQCESVLVHDTADIRNYLRLLQKGKNNFMNELQFKQQLEGQSKNTITIKQYMQNYNNMLNYVVIDEVFMLDSEIIKLKQELEQRGVVCIFGGLLHNFRREYFPFKDYSVTKKTMEDLMDTFDTWMFFTAPCEVCGTPAHYTQRLTEGLPSNYYEPLIVIGDLDYEPRCENCHELPKHQITNKSKQKKHKEKKCA